MDKPCPDARVATHRHAVSTQRAFHRLAGTDVHSFRLRDRNRLPLATQAASYPINRVEVTEQPDAESAVLLHRHNESYITGLLDQNHDEVLKTFELVAFKYPAENKDILFKAYITRKKR